MLLVEDNPVNQRVTARLLEKSGFEVQIAAEGYTAISAAAAGRFDLILLDLVLPGLDGFEVSRRIRAAESEAGLPRVAILAMSAAIEAEEAAHCEAAGMDGFLAKPVGLAELREKLAVYKIGGEAGA